MAIEVENLVKTYERQRAVDGVSFAGRPGEVLGFLGPNGAGKSTTMKIATGYLAATSGRVRVSGHDVAQDTLAARRHLGYLPEHNALYPDMYVREYLPFAASLHGLRGGASRRRVAEVIELTGLGREQHKQIGALSKGYRQRVGLAQALVHDPDVLILDEPTTGLDPNQLTEVRALIRQLGKEKTVVLSTHIMQEVQAVCDRVVIISLGKLVADSPVAALRDAAPRVVVEFEEDIDPAPLRAIEGVGDVTRRAAGVYHLEVSGAPRAVRAAVFRTAAAHQLPLLGLGEEENSLENVFRRLTQ